MPQLQRHVSITHCNQRLALLRRDDAIILPEHVECGHLQPCLVHLRRPGLVSGQEARDEHHELWRWEFVVQSCPDRVPCGAAGALGEAYDAMNWAMLL